MSRYFLVAMLALLLLHNPPEAERLRRSARVAGILEAMEQHIDLWIEGTDPPRTQPVEVRPEGEDRYTVLYSPGFVEGIAAGDVIRVSDGGQFEVLSRGGNLAVKLACSSGIGPWMQQIHALFEPLGGRCDGQIENATVWTVPVGAGFPAIEAALAEFQAAAPDSGWWYGNVYGPDDEPLGWWEDARALGRRHPES